jgi:hypothetical protein
VTLRSYRTGRRDKATFTPRQHPMDCTVGCTEPKAPWKSCVVCGVPVKTCASMSTGCCPYHDGDTVSFGWVCSAECFDIVAGNPYETDVLCMH